MDELYLANNSISDITALSAMIGITILELGNNSISDISVLAGMTGIDQLHLPSNSITTGVANLITLTSATVINLFDNNGIPCADLTILTTALPGVVTEPSSCI